MLCLQINETYVSVRRMGMILADKIILLRKRKGWSQEELAEQLGVTETVCIKMGRSTVSTGYSENYTNE